MKDIPDFPSVQEFLFEASLYTEYSCHGGAMANAKPLFRLYNSSGHLNIKVDGYCIYCKKEVPFRVDKLRLDREIDWDRFLKDAQSFIFYAHCQRDNQHSYVYHIRLRRGLIFKIGQFPSLADISQREIRPYLRFMDDDDRKELGTAIGLSAHDVGIGSFVYLRRVFERLIRRIFDERQEENGWDIAEFEQKRMDERVKFLESYLPDFLVKNRKIYSILSDGIHSLSDEKCSEYFPALKNSILVILAEEKRQREDKEFQEGLTKSINQIRSDKTDSET